MKKLKFQTLGISVNDLLSREQMKKVIGGSGGSGGGSCGVQVSNSDGSHSWLPVNDDNGNGYTRDEASSVTSGQAIDTGNYNYVYTTGHWCCDSCPWN